MEAAIAKLSISTLCPIINKLGSYVYDSYFGGDVTAEDIKKLTVFILPTIKTVIEEAESVPLEHLGPWLDELQDAAMEAEDLIDLYDYNKIKYQVSSLPKLVIKSINKSKQTLGFILPKSTLRASFEKLQNLAEEGRGKLLPLIKAARRRLKDTNPQAARSTSTVSTLSSPIFGREKECDIIIKFLLEESHADSNGRAEKIPIIAIQGIGGFGKTSTAQGIYNNKRVENFDLKMWVHVSRSFDVRILTKEIMESANKGECPHIDNLDVLQEKLKESISKAKKFLLVLDDIWCENKIQWDQLLSPLNEVRGSGSKIIITTRMEKVASILHVDQVVSLEELKTNDCWSILKHYAFGNSEITIEDRELENIGNQIISKVKYSPLALKVVGSSLYKQVSFDKWENIFAKDILKETMDVLLLSFQNLPSHLQRCFAYCSLFPKGYEFTSAELVPLWIAQGFVENINESLEEKGRIFFEELISYSFFEKEYESCCKMHDLLHDLAQKVSNKYYHRIEEDSLNVPPTCIHLSMYGKDNFKKVEIPDMSKLKKLRSLIILDHSEFETAFENKKDIFQYLAKLRALYVQSHYEVEALSYRRICELKHLRYLNLRCNNNASELQPDKLYHLQFLYLSSPQRFAEDIPDYNPKLNIGKLTSLRSFDIFCPKKNDVNGMMPLKNLNLHGLLSIHRLENVKNEVWAAEAMLNKKENLKELSFEWSNTLPCLNSIDGLNSHEDVLEGLEPHPNLEVLYIKRYQGVKVSKWMKNKNCLTCLNGLYLYRCNSLKEVPYLPHRLKKLIIRECNELMQLPPIGDTLQTLVLRDCSKLMPPPMSNKSLPLSDIQITRCSGNESQLFNDLPFLSNLNDLILDGFFNLQTFPKLSPTVTSLIIENFPKLTSIESLQQCTSLYLLYIRECPMLMTDESILVDGDITLRLPCSILYLELHGSGSPFPLLLEENLHLISSLICLQLVDFTTLPSLEKLSLKKLWIKECHDVELLPNLPISLELLHVDRCPKLKVKYEEGGPLYSTISHIPVLNFHHENPYERHNIIDVLVQIHHRSME